MESEPTSLIAASSQSSASRVASEARVKDYFLYVKRGEPQSMRLWQMVLPFESRVWVQDIDAIPMEEREDWMRYPPIVVSRRDRKAHTGENAFREMQRFHDSLRATGKIQLADPNRRQALSSITDEDWHQPMASSTTGPVCGKTFASLNPNEPGIGARILGDQEKVTDDTIQRYMALRNALATRADLVSSVPDFGMVMHTQRKRADEMRDPREYSAPGPQPGQYAAQRAGAMPPPNLGTDPMSMDTTGFVLPPTPPRPFAAAPAFAPTAPPAPAPDPNTLALYTAYARMFAAAAHQQPAAHQTHAAPAQPAAYDPTTPYQY